MSTASDSSARDVVLERLGRARAGHPGIPGGVPRAYRREGRPRGSAEVIELFLERVADYEAVVRRTDEAGLAGVIADLVPRGTIVVPPGLPEGWAAQITDEVVIDDNPRPLGVRELDRVAGVVTASRSAIATTGTIVLDHAADQGRRAITLLPDHHLCVVRAVDVVDTVPDAIRELDPTRPLTFVSGPSATSDIELQRVRGVHGPRHLTVVVVDASEEHA